MRPILYSSTETVFTSNGIGALSDVVSAIVREERNGAYELTMEYPADGIHFSEIQFRSIIVAKPNPTDDPQPFRVYRITKPIGGIAEIYAQHISYDLSGVAISPFKANTLAEAITAIHSHALPANQPFTLTTDKNAGTAISVAAPTSFRALMGDPENGLLGVYDGEYYYDKYSIVLCDHRGENRGFSLRYGSNLTSFEQDENCSAVYTHVYPYWANEDVVVEVSNGENGKLVPTTTEQQDYTKVLPLDMTSYFEGKPTAANLLTAAQNYCLEAKLGVPDVSLTVSFDQWNQGFYGIVALCDTVTVIFPKMGVNATAKVVATEYDVIQERFSNIDVGSSPEDIVSTIAEQQAQIRSIPNSANMQKAINSATAWITGANGGHVVFVKDADGKPQEILIYTDVQNTGEQRQWRWNVNGLGYSDDGGATYKTAITCDGHIVADTINLNTAYISGELSAGNIDASGLHVSSANIDGTITAGQIDATNLHVGSANIDGTISANKISGGTIDADTINVSNLNASNLKSGYVPAARISDENTKLSSLFADNGTFNTLNATTINGTQRMTFATQGTIIGGTSVTTGTGSSAVSATWADIINIASSGSTAKFG